MNNFKDYNDYELVYLAQEQNEDALNIIYKKYEPIVYKKCRKYLNFLKGVELCDLIQECNIILLNAIKTYNQDNTTTFYTFITICIDRHLVNLYRKNLNNKNKILNDSVSLDYDFDDDKNLIDIIEDETNNPEVEFNKELNIVELYNKIIDKLTDLEECVFILKIQNFDYREIASILDKDKKSIDNAMQRIKFKIKPLLHISN